MAGHDEGEHQSADTRYIVFYQRNSTAGFSTVGKQVGSGLPGYILRISGFILPPYVIYPQYATMRYSTNAVPLDAKNTKSILTQ